MTDITLFFFPGSYASQKAVLALHEKEIKFKRHLINIHSLHGDQNEPWYMRMNPNGTVPVLKHGDKVVCDSDEIINYVDKNILSGSTLIPSVSSEAGREVVRIREMLGTVEIGVITYGILQSPELSVTGIKFPKGIKSNKEGIRKRLEGNYSYINSMMAKYADLREAYQAKLQWQQNVDDNSQNQEKIEAALAKCDKIFDQIEETLKKIHESSGISDCWLVGPRFTAADVALAVLLMRLNFLGLENRFFPQEKRPHVYRFNQQMLKRKSVLLTQSEMKSLPGMMMWSKVKDAAPYMSAVAAVGVVVGVAFAVMKK